MSYHFAPAALRSWKYLYASPTPRGVGDALAGVVHELAAEGGPPAEGVVRAVGVEAGLDRAVLDAREERVGRRRRRSRLRLVVVHGDGLERLRDHVQLAVDLRALDGHLGRVAELALELRGDVEERPARASLPRLSFGAMNRSGPPPLAASSSNFLNRSSNLMSWIVSLRSGLAALILSVTVFSAVASVPAPEP